MGGNATDPSANGAGDCCCLVTHDEPIERKENKSQRIFVLIISVVVVTAVYRTGRFIFAYCSRKERMRIINAADR